MFRRSAPEAPKAEQTDKSMDSSEKRDASEQMSSESENTTGEEIVGTPEAVEDGDASQNAGETENSALAGVDHEHVKRLEGEVKENYDKYLRAMAELENFKKRAIRERSDLLKYSGENLARDLIEVADNFGLAFSQDLSAANPEIIKGFQMIQEQLAAVLQKHDIRMESSLGQIFDPVKQQALASVPTNEKPAGTVLEEFKKAYFIKDKLLRPGQVVVAVEPKVESAENKDEGNKITE